MSIAKRRHRAGRFNKIFDAFVNEQPLNTGEFVVTNSPQFGWLIWGPKEHGGRYAVLRKKDGHFICRIELDKHFPAYMALCIRAARVATGENCFFSRNGVVYFKSVLLEVPYGTEFKIPNRGEITK